MQEDDIRQAVTGHLEKTGLHFDRGTDLFEASVIDSMGVLELVAFIEDELHIFLEQKDLVVENFRSVDDIVRTLANVKGLL